MLFVLHQNCENGVTSKLLSPTANIIEFLQKFGLENEIFKCAQSQDSKTAVECKKLLKRKIMENEFNSLQATCLLYKNLYLSLDTVPNIRIHPWWIFANRYPKYARQVSAVVAIMCGSQPKNMYIYSRYCTLCAQRLPENTQHVLLECEALSHLREIHIRKIKEVMPIAMRAQMENMTHSDTMCFLISGLKCNFVDEWGPIYESIASFVFAMYSKRKSILDM